MHSGLGVHCGTTSAKVWTILGVRQRNATDRISPLPSHPIYYLLIVLKIMTNYHINQYNGDGREEQQEGNSEF